MSSGDLLARELRYLYVGTDNVERDARLFGEALGGQLLGLVNHMGTSVAAVEVGQGPLVLFADHRPSGSVIPIWVVESIEDAESSLLAAEPEIDLSSVELPDGPCLLVDIPSGARFALIEIVRPGAFKRVFGTESVR